jgi:CubicO group peptidase (beta-lactamase class C family)
MESLMAPDLTNRALYPARGSYEDGYETVAHTFADQLRRGHEIGASFCVYRRGQCVIDLWGGMADIKAQRRWERDTRIVLFSVTKGFAAMAFQLLAARGLLDWSAPVAHYWPEFGAHGKEEISVEVLFNHRAGLACLDEDLTLHDCVDPEAAGKIRHAMESQTPNWRPGTDQGYHALTFGLYARELFERITGGDDLGHFVRREFFEPLNSDVHLGTPESEDSRFASLYAPATPKRVLNMLSNAVIQPTSTEAHVFREFLNRGSTMRRALLNPSLPDGDIGHYNRIPVRRSVLAWASATGTARGVARAYLPFASGGKVDGRRFVPAKPLKEVYRRRGWSDHDLVLQKPIGWSRGFAKEERHLFSPNPESFGHPGMGGTLGWADPVEEISIGYAMNLMDWRIRSPRAVALCRSLYECEALVDRG